MVGEVFHLLGQTVSGERLQDLDDAGMQHPSPLLEQALRRPHG